MWRNAYDTMWTIKEQKQGTEISEDEHLALSFAGNFHEMKTSYIVTFIHTLTEMQWVKHRYKRTGMFIKLGSQWAKCKFVQYKETGVSVYVHTIMSKA